MSPPGAGNYTSNKADKVVGRGGGGDSPHTPISLSHLPQSPALKTRQKDNSTCAPDGMPRSEKRHESLSTAPVKDRERFLRRWDSDPTVPSSASRRRARLTFSFTSPTDCPWAMSITSRRRPLNAKNALVVLVMSVDGSTESSHFIFHSFHFN